MPHALRLALMLIAAALAAGVSSTASAAGQSAFSAGPEYMRWTERDDDDSKILDEIGWRFRVGLEWAGDLTAPWSAHMHTRAYLGDVNYRGSTFGGQPVQTETGYRGWDNEIQLRHAYTTASSRFYGFGSLGLDFWRRAIWNQVLRTDQIERYRVLYGRVGVGTEHALGAGFNANVGLKYPFFVWEDVDVGFLGYNGTPQLRPGRDVGLTAEVGKRLNERIMLQLGYDVYRFKRSDPVVITSDLPENPDTAILQPRSIMEMIYLRFVIDL